MSSDAVLGGAGRDRPGSPGTGPFRRDGLTAAAGLDWQRDVAAAVGAGHRPPATLIWRCAPALVVGGAERGLPGFGDACERLAAEGWPVCGRDIGGSAFPVGLHSVQLARILPRRSGASLERFYRCMAEPVVAVLARLGLGAATGTVPDAFCAGSRDIAVGGRKLAGLAQVWRGPVDRGGYVMITASVLLDGEPEALCHAVNRFHELAGGTLRCRPQAVTSVCRELGGVPDGSGLAAAFDAALAEALSPEAGDTVPRALPEQAVGSP
ncbi:lipoate--protein ligase family protein [Arhodomonas aquaeolei]|uniref:lipoate--protein ligase family protein n=1 Tax=Arhodomonas aquaeolei TaxID=2369 RepID=UPI00036B70CD|nr:lipoate--protein ligase family protein [Arhodomonas aquaeolei]MCS4504611.1 lipoate--protein ligase family protein [Arhodomonas aquaeolei]